MSSVPIMAGVMISGSSAKVMGHLVIPFKWRIVGWAATAVMGVAAWAMLRTDWM